MKPWFENEAFWRAFYPKMFDEKRFADAAEQVRQVLRLAGRRRGAVLDLCCGPGRHSVALAKRGWQVTGVDRTRFLLNKARQLARTSRTKVEFIEADMRDFVRPAAFDLVINLFTSFGYFDNKDDDRRVLRNIFTSLKPGGVLVMDVMGKERIAKVLQPTSSTRYPDGSLMIEVREIFDDWTRIRNEWLLIKGSRVQRFKFHHTLYSGQELKDRLRAAGFADVKLFGNLAGQPFGPDAPRLVAVARKK
jgi:SAM-dependent methyltransferase